MYTCSPSLSRCSWSCLSPRTRRPNVVIILADDLGWADLGCFDSKFHSTPSVDRLAADGLRFTDAYASCPVCYPHYSNQGVQPGAAIREGDFKLIEFYDTGRRELYDLNTDISESKNLIDAKPDVAKRLAERLAGWRRDVGAQEMRPSPEYVPNPQAVDGTVKLPARTADVKGLQLRYEPLPHKNTLGFWTRVEDTASWEFTVTKPGNFVVEVLQGCGKGQGGSEVEFVVAGQVLKMLVEDTGGFQNFKPRDIGSITVDKAGRYTLTVRPQTKAKAAVMDLRQVVLKPKG